MTRLDQPVPVEPMKLFGRWRILVEGDERVLAIFPWQRKGLDYLMSRLFEGKEVSADALEHYGVTVRELGDADEVITVPPEASYD